MKNCCIKCSSLTGTVRRSPSWSLQVRSYWDYFSTSSPSHPIINFLCMLGHTEHPRVYRPVSLHRAFPRTGIFPLPCQDACTSPCWRGKLLLNTKVWLPTCVFGKACAAYPPTLQAELVILFLSWNKASYILVIILHLFCLCVCLPNTMLSLGNNSGLFISTLST